MKLAQTTLSRRDSLKIARRFNAGNGSACASSPAGAREVSARSTSASQETMECSYVPLSFHALRTGTVRAPSATRQFQPSLRDSIHFATSPGVETPGYGRSSFRDKTAVRFGKLRRSDLFVENQSVQDSKLRRSGIFRRHKDVAPTELNNFLIALATKIPLLRSWQMQTARN